ncbi:MAG TPA: hypothetical protein VGO11_07900 [Chthoniobacteraceae bacterium]|jgi:hypothetical protein|nr:hypothetical protein [Chthoniobacteraceae bacterium]
MTQSKPWAPSYRKPLAVSAGLQLVIILVNSNILDHGFCWQLSMMAAAAYWGGALVLMQRHPHPTQLDLSLVRIGYLPTLALTAFLAPLVWHIRGVL